MQVLAYGLFAFLVVYSAAVTPAYAIGGEQYVKFESGKGAFPLSVNGLPAPLFASSKDYPGVIRILRTFGSDLESVTGTQPEISTSAVPKGDAVVLVGTLGRNRYIDRLVHDKKLDTKGVEGCWDTYLIQTVERPFPGVGRALVIAGSDKRGTIYGMLDISERMGVSPWHWWADVPPKHHSDLYILPGRHTDGPPSVKYRGIFLNDEDPDLTRWVREKYGAIPPQKDPPIPPGVANYGHEFYERIFDVLLRLKGNYLWPAMWNNAFNEDDPENARLADEYGIVMGTSHQEPMLRAQKEWDRRYKQTLGSWNYAKYPDTLQNFWREGIRRNKHYESIITIGLRGADDTPMAPGGPEENMALLEKIIDVQRSIIREEMNPDVTKVPQLWCLYKEVLDFYKAGMRVPDDVTLLWPDDNWGDNRRLPTAEERRRSGGAGIYYHFDYHGGPRNYQWINTNPIAKVWQQMSLAKEYGADRIWIVNVGHFKGYEFPLEYFMDLAWKTDRWTNQNINDYTREWAKREFGEKYAGDIADVIAKYTKYNGRRKPELLSPSTYSLVNYSEAETVVKEFQAITRKAEDLSAKLPQALQDAFYELVLFPTKASSIVNELYLAAGKNQLYARQGRASANDMAQETRTLFTADTALMAFFNRDLAHGKWSHFMDQTHLGYTSWVDPPSNSLRAIPLTELEVPDSASLGIAVEGSEDAWPGPSGDPLLPSFDPVNRQRRWIDIFNRGKTPFSYTIHADKPWVSLESKDGRVEKQTRVWISVDWDRIPKEDSDASIMISGTDRQVTVHVKVLHPSGISRESLRGFFEGDRHVSMEAAHFSKKSDAGNRRWIEIEDYGHTLSAMETTSPVDAPPAEPGKDAPCLEYRMYLTDAGNLDVEAIFGSILNFMPDRGVRYAISFDNESPQIITLVPKDYSAQNGNGDWERSVSNNARYSHSSHRIAEAGYHTLKVWMVDPGVVLEKIIVDLGGVRPSYLGPPESYHHDIATR